jgi:hypothetical protein
MNKRFVICIDNKGYQVLDDAEAQEDGMIRVVDDTGEDYLFGEQRFVAVELPPAAEESFATVVA